MSSHIATALVSLVAVVGCNQLLPPSMQSGVSAANPLDGQSVAWKEKAEGLPFEGEQACSTWPIENELTATATATQICAKGHFYKLRDAAAGDPGTDSLRVDSDGTGDPTTAGEANEKGIASGRARKIGQCVDHGAVKSVWELAYDGCVANKGVEGGAALTKRSTYLEIGAARWKFSPAPNSETASASPK